MSLSRMFGLGGFFFLFTNTIVNKSVINLPLVLMQGYLLILAYVHLGRDLPMHQAGADLLQSSSVEKDLGVLVDKELSLSQQCPGRQGQLYPGVNQEQHCQKVREVILPLCSAMVRPDLECCVQLGCSR